MNMNSSEVIHPIAIVKEAVAAWARHLIPIAAVSSVSIFVALLPQVIKPVLVSLNSGSIAGRIGWLVLYFAAMLIVIALSSFLTLVILSYVSAAKGQKVSILQAIRQAVSGIAAYLKSYLVVVFIVSCFLLIGTIIFLVGRAIFPGGAPQGIRFFIFLVTSTIFVAAIIAAGWYAFFFSLSPLVAAFEKASPVASIKQSRSRVKGNALRYMASLLCVVLVYLVVGLSVYALVTRLTQQNNVLGMIDPVMQVVFGPILMAVWFMGYRKLTELRNSIEHRA